MLTLITKWEEIIENFHSFNSPIITPNLIVVERLNRFYHWYYLPSAKIFAPSKYLGYKKMTLLDYNGAGSGVKTQEALEPFFKKINRDSEIFKKLLADLSHFLNKFNKEVSVRTTTGSGGIYLPNDFYHN